MRKFAFVALVSVVLFGCSYREVEYKEKYCSKIVGTKHYTGYVFGILPDNESGHLLYIVLEDGREIFAGYNKAGLPPSFSSDIEKHTEDGKYCEYHIYRKKTS